MFDPERFDAVLMDVQMPRLDGYAATRAIRERGDERRVPVLAMTAAAIEGERERCLAAGMDDFLTKPVDPEALAAALATWLGTEPAPAPVLRRTASPAPRDLDLARLDMLRDLAPGDTTYLDRAIGNFVSSGPDHLDAIRAAVDDADPIALRASAHRLAGGAANLGLIAVAAAARDLELLADKGTHTRRGGRAPAPGRGARRRPQRGPGLPRLVRRRGPARLRFHLAVGIPGGVLGKDPVGRASAARREGNSMKGLLGLLIVIWLVIGAVAAFQRGYFGDDEDVSCKEFSDTAAHDRRRTAQLPRREPQDRLRRPGAVRVT